MDDSGNLHLTYPKEIRLTQLSPLGHTLTTHISFVYSITKKSREVTGFPNYDLFQTDPCGLQLFHLLSHTNGSGGATLLVDGFYVASIFKELHPESYDLLSRIPVPAHSAGESTALYSPSPPSGYPVLGHDPLTGELTQVRWNNDDRSVMNHLQPDLVEKWCFIYGLFIFRFQYNIKCFFLILGTTLFEHGTSALKVQTPNFGYSFNPEPQFVCIFFEESTNIYSL